MNVGGKGIRWNVDAPRLGAWQQIDIDTAIRSDRCEGSDEIFGNAEVVRDVVYGRPYPIGEVYAKPKWMKGKEKLSSPVVVPDNVSVGVYPQLLPLFLKLSVITS